MSSHEVAAPLAGAREPSATERVHGVGAHGGVHVPPRELGNVAEHVIEPVWVGPLLTHLMCGSHAVAAVPRDAVYRHPPIWDAGLGSPGPLGVGGQTVARAALQPHKITVAGIDGVARRPSFAL